MLGNLDRKDTFETDFRRSSVALEEVQRGICNQQDKNVKIHPLRQIFGQATTSNPCMSYKQS